MHILLTVIVNFVAIHGRISDNNDYNKMKKKEKTDYKF